MSDRSVYVRPIGISAPDHAAAGPALLRPPRSVTRSETAWIVIGLVTLAGFGLRIAAAQGDLWLDEIWSLNLVAGIRSAGGVFWDISHDNNHYLNSLWLYLAGPDRSALVYRAPAVLFGTLSILMAARIGFRRSPATAVAAAGLTACAFPFVNYGSEARGYAGLILATLLAVDSFERTIEPLLAPCLHPAGARPDRHWPRWVLGLAIGFGALSHFSMLAVLILLGFTAIIRLLQAGRSLGRVVDQTIGLFGPSLALLVPAMAAVMAGLLVHGGFEVGGASPFSAASFLVGYGDLIRLMLGLPGGMPAWVALAAGGVGVAIAVWYNLVDPRHYALIFAGLVVVPALMLAARLPNLEFPRYYLGSGTVFLLFEADVIGGMWDRGGRGSRCVVAALISLVAFGQYSWDASLLRDGRGSYSVILDTMASEGRPAYASVHRFKIQTVVDYLAARRGTRFDYSAPGTFCRDRPGWYIDLNEDERDPPSSIEIGPSDCRATFVQRASYPASMLSGMRWTLYRRDGLPSLGG